MQPLRLGALSATVLTRGTYLLLVSLLILLHVDASALQIQLPSNPTKLVIAACLNALRSIKQALAKDQMEQTRLNHLVLNRRHANVLTLLILQLKLPHSNVTAQINKLMLLKLSLLTFLNVVAPQLMALTTLTANAA
jgi:hypothetical protein